MYTDYQAEIHFLTDPQLAPAGVERNGQHAPAQNAGEELGYAQETCTEAECKPETAATAWHQSTLNQGEDL